MQRHIVAMKKGGLDVIKRWSSLFTEQYPVAGVSERELQAVTATLFAPITDDEAVQIRASRSVLIDGTPAVAPSEPRNWWLPRGSLPASYLDFLRWSNGGSFLNGERRFDPFLPASTLRETLLSHAFPQFMPLTLPFASNGGGCFYAFDMRQSPLNGEYPILFVSLGNLSYDDAVPVANSFPEACRGSVNPTFHWMD